MGHTICVSSIKGGCGKTTTAVNLSTALAIAEKKVLLVDCDPQGHATSSMGIDKAALKYGLYEVMLGKTSAMDSIVESELDTLKTLPATFDLFRNGKQTCYTPQCIITNHSFVAFDQDHVPAQDVDHRARDNQRFLAEHLAGGQHDRGDLEG